MHGNILDRGLCFFKCRRGGGGSGGGGGGGSVESPESLNRENRG